MGHRETNPVIAASLDPSTPWKRVTLRKGESFSSRRILELKKRTPFLFVQFHSAKTSGGGIRCMRPDLFYAALGNWKAASRPVSDLLKQKRLLK